MRCPLGRARVNLVCIRSSNINRMVHRVSDSFNLISSFLPLFLIIQLVSSFSCQDKSKIVKTSLILGQGSGKRIKKDKKKRKVENEKARRRGRKPRGCAAQKNFWRKNSMGRTSQGARVMIKILCGSSLEGEHLNTWWKLYQNLNLAIQIFFHTYYYIIRMFAYDC